MKSSAFVDWPETKDEKVRAKNKSEMFFDEGQSHVEFMSNIVSGSFNAIDWELVCGHRSERLWACTLGVCLLVPSKSPSQIPAEK